MINNYIEQATVQKVKKFHSTMNQALLMAIKDNGMVNTWDIYVDGNETKADKLIEYFKPYLRIMNDCKYDNKKCNVVGTNLKFLNGTPRNFDYGISNNYYKLILDDGSAIWASAIASKTPCMNSEGPNACALFFYDINGDKKPNTFGKDIFAFYLLKNSLIPRGTDDCKLSSSGWGCAKYILTHGDMKYPK